MDAKDELIRDLKKLLQKHGVKTFVAAVVHEGVTVTLGDGDPDGLAAAAFRLQMDTASRIKAW